MLELLYSKRFATGRSCGISLNDLNLKDGTVRILGKGTRSESSRWGQKQWKRLRTILTPGPAWKNIQDKTALFLLVSGKRMTPGAVYHIVPEVFPWHRRCRQEHPICCVIPLQLIYSIQELKSGLCRKCSAILRSVLLSVIRI